MQVATPDGDVGVIVGRFQVPYLTDAHKEMLDEVCSRHKRVAVFLGVARVVSRSNPLGFETRRQMIQERYPNITVLPIQDTKYDDVWVDNLEQQIGMLFPCNSVVLYGGRDSFVKCYNAVYEEWFKKPKYQTVQFKEVLYTSGTKLREEAANSVIGFEAYRTGIIFALHNQFPKVVPTVDVAIIKPKEQMLLLGKRRDERKWRFIGGYVDVKDLKKKHTVRRETNEETQCSIGDIRYLDSVRVNDWRYRNDVDQIHTDLFEAEYLQGPVQPSDDMAGGGLRWFKWSDLEPSMMEEEHVPLLEIFLKDHNNEIARNENKS